MYPQLQRKRENLVLVLLLIFIFGCMLSVLNGCSKPFLKYDTKELFCKAAGEVCAIIDSVCADTVQTSDFCNWRNSLWKEQKPVIEIVEVSVPEPYCVIAGDFKNVYFDEDKAELKPGSLAILKQIEMTLKECPDIDVVITGHADERRSEEYNRELGFRRAVAVTNWFVSRKIDGWRMYVDTKGETEPFATGHSEDFWKLNRRVEIRVR